MDAEANGSDSFPSYYGTVYAEIDAENRILFLAVLPAATRLYCS